MARRCVFEGIPMIASRGATTSHVIEMAQTTGFTVIGFIRGDKMNIYTSPCVLRMHRYLPLNKEFGLKRDNKLKEKIFEI